MKPLRALLLVAGALLGTGGATLLAAGYAAAGALGLAAAVAAVVVALRVTWRLDDAGNDRPAPPVPHP